jgi:glycosyltransferase involved in cell wall biosynthesis
MSFQMGKLIFISHSGDKTGSPIVLTRLFRWAVEEEKQDAFLVFRYHGALVEELKKEFGEKRIVTIRRTSPRDISNFLKPFSKLVDLWILLALFRTLKPSVVIVNSLINTTSIAASLLVKAKVVVWSHEVPGSINDPFHMRSYWIKKAHAGIGDSRQSCDFLNELGLSPLKIHLVYNGLDLNRFIQREPTGIKKEPKDLLRLGALAFWSPNKRLDLVIETAVKVAQSGKYPQIRLDIVGSIDPWFPNLFEEMKARFKELPQNLSVRFLGHIPEIGEFYQNIDGMLLTSDKESLPTVAMEALAYQIPVFSFDDLPGVGEILGDLALQAKERAGIALAAEVIHFFDTSDFAITQANWQKGALERARLFTLENQWKNFQKVFNEIV